MGMRRAEQMTDTIYVLPDDEGAFFTPDGEGRIYYDSLDEAVLDVIGADEMTVTYLTETPEEN